MKTEAKTVKINFGTDAVPRVVERAYQAIEYENIEDILSAFQATDDKGKNKLIDCLNYGWDLKVRASIRNDMVSADAGPERSFESTVKQTMKARAAIGKPVTEERARELVKIMQES